MSAIDHHDDHADEPWLQHHWNNSGQQFEAGKLGMWLFLATEFLLFAGLFCAYAVYRSNHPELFEYGAKFLDWKLGATNTAVLIASSFTMAWAVTAGAITARSSLATKPTGSSQGRHDFRRFILLNYRAARQHRLQNAIV